jgi:hypothetical protein
MNDARARVLSCAPTKVLPLSSSIPLAATVLVLKARLLNATTLSKDIKYPWHDQIKWDLRDKPLAQSSVHILLLGTGDREKQETDSAIHVCLILESLHSELFQRVGLVSYVDAGAEWINCSPSIVHIV